MHIFISLILLPTALAAGILEQGQLRCENNTNEQVWCAFYYQQMQSLTRATPAYPLPAHNALSINLPSTKWFHTRCFACASTPENLPEHAVLSIAPFLCHPRSVGLWQEEDITLIHNTATDTCHLIASRNVRAHTLSSPTGNAHLHTEPAIVTTADASESAYYHERLAAVQEAQEAMLSMPLTRPVRIGIAASGGGFRALLCCLGVLRGLEKQQLLALITTCMGLSGATWALLPWIVSGESLTTYSDRVCTQLGNGLIHHVANQYDDFATVIKRKAAARLPISGIDLYGISLAHTLLKPLTQHYRDMTLSDVAALLNPATHPLIIATAVTRSTHTNPYHWISLSPFSVTSIDNHASIPAWALGHRFIQGTSLGTAPEPLLGYILGICGSSFSISVRDALERAPDKLHTLLDTLLPQSWIQNLFYADWSNKKLTAATLPNFCYRLDESPLASPEWLNLVDGGYLNNVPLVPLLAHAPEPYDIVIVIDAKQEAAQRVKAARENFVACAHHALVTPQPELLAHTGAVITHGKPTHETSLVYLTLENDDETSSFNPAYLSTYATPRLIYNEEKAQALLHFMERKIDALSPHLNALIKAHAEPLRAHSD